MSYGFICIGFNYTHLMNYLMIVLSLIFSDAKLLSYVFLSYIYRLLDKQIF